MCEGARALIPAEKEEKEEERIENGSLLGFKPFLTYRLFSPSSFIILIDSDLNLVNCFTTELLTSLLA